MVGEHLLKLLIFSGPPEFSPWGSWSSCDRTCGGGEKKRTRACTNYCTNVLSSNTEEARACNEHNCKFKIDFHKHIFTFLKVVLLSSPKTMLETGFTPHQQLYPKILVFVKSMEILKRFLQYIHSGFSE